MENTFQLAIQKQLTETLIQKAAQLPQNFNQTKFVQNCLSALDSIDDIEEVEPGSVVKGLMKGAILGLDFMNKECYLIPYKNKDTGNKDVNFQTDYKGEKKLAKLYSVKPIEEITTELVRVGDFYEVEVKDNKKFVNWKPIRFNNEAIEGAFSIVLFTDKSSVSAEMSKKEMDEVRTNYSKAANSPAWKNRPGEMYKKTVLRLNLKNVAKVFENPEQLRTYEEASEFEFNKPDSKNLPAAPVVKNIYTEQAKQIEAKPIETTVSEVPAAEVLPAGPGPKEELLETDSAEIIPEEVSKIDEPCCIEEEPVKKLKKKAEKKKCVDCANCHDSDKVGEFKCCKGNKTNISEYTSATFCDDYFARR